MSKSEKMQVLKQEIVRLKKAKQSRLARHIDIANLLDARDKLRALEIEAQMKISETS